MQMVTVARPRALHLTIACLLALAVVLPPKYLSAAVIALGGGAATWGLIYRRDLLFRPLVLTIGILLAIAAMFCLLGTFPISQKSDIQLEFLKYGVYAAAFALGFIAIGRRDQSNAFVIATTAVILAFFLATILTAPDTRFSINQSWPLYPPDQNNSTSILAPLSVVVLTFRARWLRIALLVLLFLFFTFVESRLGVIILAAVALAELFLDWRAALAVISACALIWVLFSLSDVGAQTAVMRLVSEVQAPMATPQHPTAVSGRAHAFRTMPPPASNPVADGSNTLTAEQDNEAPKVPKTEIVEFGTLSDDARLKIYRRALDVAAGVFPNLIGMGDARVVEMLNTPRIDTYNVYQHAHNFFLQGYLAYGLLATLSITGAAVGIALFAVRYRDWALVGALAVLGGFGMIEALTSDTRVLTILFVFLGARVASSLTPINQLASRAS